MQVMPSIYQSYVDAVTGAAKAQEAQQELQLNKVRLGLETMSLAQQIQERQLTAQIMAEYQQGGQQGTQGTGSGGQQGGGQGAGNPQSGPYSVAGGSTPNANPTTGDDPSLRQAAMYDTLSAKLASVNPKSAMEYASKASTIRNQYYTRQKDQITMRKEQTSVVANLFGSVKDQDGYTAALAEVQDRYGVNIAQFGLTGTYSTDAPKLKQIAEGSMTYVQKLNAAHQSVQEQISQETLNERVRHDQQSEGIAGARLNLETQNHALQAEWKKWDMEFKSRQEARQQAGFDRTTDEALGKSKHYAATPNVKTDGPYIDALIENDPRLSTLGPKQKQMVKAEINMTARKQLADGVKKPGDTPSWEDFMSAADSAAKAVGKRVTPGTNGFFGFGGTKASIAPRTPAGAQPKGGPLPPPVSGLQDVKDKPAGFQFQYQGKVYKKTGPDNYEEVK